MCSMISVVEDETPFEIISKCIEEYNLNNTHQITSSQRNTVTCTYVA